MSDSSQPGRRPAELVEATPGERGLRTVTVRADGETLVEAERVAFMCPTGSHLFGTADEQSDLDLKAVFLASLEAIVLGSDETKIRASSGEDNSRNTPEDVDVELIELRRFVGDLLEGHPYAIEMLHCPDELVLVETPIWQSLLAERDRLISRQLEPFVGYCRAQARKYDRKAARLSTIERVLEILEEVGPGRRIETLVDRLPLETEQVALVEQPIRNQDRPARLLEVAGKRFELRARVKKALEPLRRLKSQYGQRVRRAREEFDSKAASHAYRLAFELQELRATGRLAFPLEQADFLRDVKRGEISRQRADREIPRLVERALETPSDLPDNPDEAFWKEWLLATYLDDTKYRTHD